MTSTSSADTPVFGATAIAFFAGLKANNSRDWFTAHRDQYDTAVRTPLEQLVGIAEEHYGPGKVMRPNRDVRFSTDKSPYRTSASMWAGHVGGVYLSIGIDGIDAGVGLYAPSREQLAAARTAIAEAPVAATQLQRIVDTLEAGGYEFAGPGLITAPRGYRNDNPHIKLLRLQHYAALRHRMPISTTTQDVLETWRQGRLLIDWIDTHIPPAAPQR